MPLVPVLAAMEQAGVGFDVAQLEEMSRELAADLSEIEEQVLMLQDPQVGHAVVAVENDRAAFGQEAL